MKPRMLVALSVAGAYLFLVGVCIYFDPPTGDRLLSGLAAVVLTFPWSLALKELAGITLAKDPRWLPISIMGAVVNSVIIFARVLTLGQLIARKRRRQGR